MLPLHCIGVYGQIQVATLVVLTLFIQLDNIAEFVLWTFPVHFLDLLTTLPHYVYEFLAFSKLNPRLQLLAFGLQAGELVLTRGRLRSTSSSERLTAVEVSELACIALAILHGRGTLTVPVKGLF